MCMEIGWERKLVKQFCLLLDGNLFSLTFVSFDRLSLMLETDDD